MPPGRSSCGGSVVQSTMVLSMPSGVGPPSSTTSRRSSSHGPRSSSTWRAVVGLTRPNRLADGAAMPPPNGSSTCWATGWAGTRSPTVSRPPVTTVDTRSDRRTSTVSGPGQHAAASSSAAGGSSAAHDADVVQPHVDDHRMALGRPLTSKIRRTAAVVLGVGTEPVHRLGRDGGQSAGRRAAAARSTLSSATRHGAPCRRASDPPRRWCTVTRDVHRPRSKPLGMGRRR